MTSVLRVLRAAGCTILFSAGSAMASAQTSQAPASQAPASAASAAEAGARPFDIGADPDYANYRQAVVDYLVSRHSHADAHVCVLGERDAAGERTASVWWREGARIIVWEGRDSKLATSVSNLDLRRDVVAGEDDLHGSTYLVTRQWVSDFQARCKRSGRSFIVRRTELGAARTRH
jgi:hypothetical protein